METFWFCAVAVMVTLYVIFDGFDLGAGVLHLTAVRGDDDRRRILRSIGPVWDGNEVWLLAAGGVLFFAFPDLYATSFSGFYLPLMMVLWLLVLRGVSLELRNHIDSPIWTPVFDVGFGVASILLALFYGVALGNVVRGVPIDEHGRFFEPLWTHFRLGPDSGILDWYTVVVGLAALALLVLHGGLWLVLKTDGTLSTRMQRVSRSIWWVVLVMVALVTVLTFRVQPHVLARLTAQPWGFVFPALAIAGLAGTRVFNRRGAERPAFLASCALLAGMLTSAAFGLYPYVLPAITDPARGLTVGNAAAHAYGLGIGVRWWLPGMALVALYFTYIYRHFGGKVQLDDEEGY